VERWHPNDLNLSRSDSVAIGIQELVELAESHGWRLQDGPLLPWLKSQLVKANGFDLQVQVKNAAIEARDRYREALVDILANEDAYKRGDALSAYIAKTALGVPA
jgi:hypothetical protein